MRLCVYSLSKCVSTQTVARTWVEKGRSWEGLLFSAHTQEQGYGQRGRAWEGKPGENVYATLVLHPIGWGTQALVALNWAVSLAVLHTIKHFLPTADVAIKWPNDVWIRPTVTNQISGKIAGILIEAIWRGKQLQAVLVGVGININQRYFAAPQAISLAQIAGTVPVREVLSVFGQQISTYYAQHNKPASLHAQYQVNMLGLNTRLSFLYKNQPLEALVQGINSQGQLILQHQQKTLCISPTQIQWLI